MGLGSVMEAEDIDGDGNKDLLLGCPLSAQFLYDKNPGMAHAGSLFVVYSSSNHSKWSNKVNDIAIIADASLNGSAYDFFGQSMAVVNGNLLLVGAPGSRNSAGTTVGKVYVFNITKNMKSR